MKEIIALRTENSKTYDLGGERRRVVIDPTFQPPAKDTYLSEDGPDGNWGTSTAMWLRDWASYIERLIPEFDISGLPAGQILTSAKLQLYYWTYNGVDPVGKTVWAYKLTRTDWVEAQATWNIYKAGSNWTTPGGDYVTSNPSGGSTIFPASPGWMYWDILAIVQDAYGKTIPAEFLVKFADETYTEETASEPAFRTKEYGPVFQPKLVIEYAVSVPTVTTLEATNVQATTARLNGQISDDGGEACEYRFRYKKSGGEYSYTTWTGAKTTGQTFYEDLSGLDTRSLYHFNAQAKNSAGESAWGGELSFTTKLAAPTNVQATDGIHTDKVVITWTKSTGATGYQVYRDGVGLEWLGDVATYDDTEAGAPTITPGAAVASDGEFADKVALSLSEQSVSNGTSHTYKVRARNATGESADSTTNTGYRGHGALTYQWQRSAGNSDASYSNIPGATTADYNDIGAPADGSGRYYRCVENATGAAQAISSADRGYRITSPTVTTQPVSNIGNIGATGNATITDDGGEACSKRGVCWNTTGNPDTSDSKSEETDSFGVGAFTRLMTGLTPGQKYYVKGYAINPAGTSYGGEVSFTTKPSAPSNLTATTISETQIDLTWTKGAGAVNTVIRRKVNAAPISPTDGVEVYDGPGTSHNDTTCNPGVHYYYRAWSYHPTSGYSDSYATADSSTTVAPTGTTEAATLIGDVDATLNGKVTDDGGEPCQVRFQYGEDIGYGTDTAWQTGKVTDDVFSQRITGLAPSTEYHFRAQIKNSAGAVDGDDKEFTTIELPTPFLRRVLRDVFGSGLDINAANPLRVYDPKVFAQIDKLAGEAPVESSVEKNWNTAGDSPDDAGGLLVNLGTAATKKKLHSLLLDVSALTDGAIIHVKLFIKINGTQRKVYDETFTIGTDPDGLWIVNGTVGIHDILSVAVYSDKDESVAIGYTAMLEAM